MNYSDFEYIAKYINKNTPHLYCIPIYEKYKKHEIWRLKEFQYQSCFLLKGLKIIKEYDTFNEVLIKIPELMLL